MKQLLRLLFVSLLSQLWRSMEAAQNQNLVTNALSTSFCYNSNSVKSCFTTFHSSSNHPVRRSFQGASDWCKQHVNGSSLIVINSTDSQRAVEDFLGKQVLTNETIIMDARKLSSGKSPKWSWVNDHQTIPPYFRGEILLDGACVTSKDGQSLVYCKGPVETSYRYICETSDANATSEFSYPQNNKTYVASLKVASWYDAREECLHFGGDLASITDLQSISHWSRLTEFGDHVYWIGLYRNRWIWNSTGAPLTYTNWDRDSRDQTADNHCICINPGCMRNRKANTICDDNRKWRTCHCDQNNYTIVCQKDENSVVSTTQNVVTTVRLQSTRRSTTRKNSPNRSVNKRTTSSKMTSATNPFTVTNSYKTASATIPSTITTSTTTTSATAPSTITTSTTTTSATAPSKITTPTTTTSATAPSTITTSPTTTKATTPSTITNSTKTTRATTPSTITKSTKIISASTMTQKSFEHVSENQTTAFETSSTGLSGSFSTATIILVVLVLVAVGFIIAAIILVIRKRRHDRHHDGSSTKNTTQSDTVAPVYATVVPGNRPPDDTAPAANPIYADIEITQQTAPSKNAIHASVQPTNVIYAEPNKPMKASTQKGEAIQEQGPIYQDAIEVKPGAKGGGVAMQDPSAIYAEPMKMKKPS